MMSVGVFSSSNSQTEKLNDGVCSSDARIHSGGILLNIPIGHNSTTASTTLSLSYSTPEMTLKRHKMTSSKKLQTPRYDIMARTSRERMSARQSTRVGGSYRDAGWFAARAALSVNVTAS